MSSRVSQSPLVAPSASFTLALAATAMLALALALGAVGSGCDTAHAAQSEPLRPTTGAAERPAAATAGQDTARRAETPASGHPAPPPATPTPAPPAEPPAPRRVTIAGTGDLLIHQRVAEAARLHADEGGFDWSFRGLTEAIRPDDIAFVNLETPLTLEFRDPQSVQPPVLGAPPEVASALAHAGVDVVGVANNHAYDQTARGLLATLERTHAAGIVAVGAGHDDEEAYAPIFIERSGVRVAFVSFTDRLNSSPERWDDTTRVARLQNEAGVRTAMAHARASADIVVVALHTGEEWADGVSRNSRANARHLIELGADVILGTGPHVLLPVERVPTPRGEAVIAYSLGNSISNQGLKYLPGHIPPGIEGPHEESPLPRDSALVRIELEVSAAGQIRVASLTAVPFWTLNNWRRRIPEHTEVVQIARLSTCDDRAREERWPIIARTLGPAVTLVP